MSVADLRYKLWLEAEADKAGVFDQAEREAFKGSLSESTRAQVKQVSFAAEEVRSAWRKSRLHRLFRGRRG